MTKTLHDPILVDRVMCKLIELRNPLVDVDKLTEDQLADWTAQAIEVINIVHDVPAEDVAFFDETQLVDDYLEPWRDVLGTLSTEDSPMTLSVGGAGGGKAVEQTGGGWTDIAPHALISGRNGGPKRIIESGLRLVTEVEDTK